MYNLLPYLWKMGCWFHEIGQAPSFFIHSCAGKEEADVSPNHVGSALDIWSQRFPLLKVWSFVIAMRTPCLVITHSPPQYFLLCLTHKTTLRCIFLSNMMHQMLGFHFWKNKNWLFAVFFMHYFLSAYYFKIISTF